MAGHGMEQVPFEDLNFQGRAIRKHVRDARDFGKDPDEVHRTTINQVERLLQRLHRDN
jgi:hypothetical protein